MTPVAHADPPSAAPHADNSASGSSGEVKEEPDEEVPQAAAGELGQRAFRPRHRRRRTNRRPGYYSRPQQQRHIPLVKLLGPRCCQGEDKATSAKHLTQEALRWIVTHIQHTYCQQKGRAYNKLSYVAMFSSASTSDFLTRKGRALVDCNHAVLSNFAAPPLVASAQGTSECL